MTTSSVFCRIKLIIRLIAHSFIFLRILFGIMYISANLDDGKLREVSSAYKSVFPAYLSAIS